jgi:hypothetical protein
MVLINIPSETITFFKNISKYSPKKYIIFGVSFIISTTISRFSEASNARMEIGLPTSILNSLFGSGTRPQTAMAGSTIYVFSSIKNTFLSLLFYFAYL